MKKCTKCQIEKPEQDFHKDKRTKSGLYSACKVCHSKQTTEYSKEYRTTYNGNGYMKEYRKTEKNKQYMKEYRKKHNSSEYIRVYMKEYRQTEKNKVYRKEWFNQYRKAPQHRIEASIVAGIWQALKAKKAGRSWEVLVGYTLEDLIQHLESQFNDKMNWDNYGSYWHVDHIKPKSLFKFETAEDPEFRECWALANLQPLEAIVNLKKGNKFR